MFDMKAFPAQNPTAQSRSIGLEHAQDIVDAFATFTDLDESFDNDALLAYLSRGPEQRDDHLAGRSRPRERCEYYGVRRFGRIPIL